ncbi:FAD-dependent oxidoreductase [Nocardia sp. SYP-A9097]|uniref:phytoene desaturase family protein n=1 Tax=Nocardia sp. SYP-A9097 TaxID=2663237 RepID=UPI00129BC043|nr:NAD(P)/FAD-dependent oxidoreductase [Nocardia sp. SYP-A9097]MRH90096.1 FAD-dependent oxidoreductase [Nocardia sp. SYP-A9097]
MDEHDVIVVGAGHNGLTAAAYLAAAGLDVLVLEAKSEIGGGVVSEQVTLPGHQHDLHAAAHIFIQGNPMIRDDELGLLSEHGLSYVFPDPSMSVVFPDGDFIAFYSDVHKTAETIARISPADAENYLRFYEFASPLLDQLLPSLFVPPAPLGALFAQLEQSEIGRETMRVLMMSYLDVCNEWFEHPKVKAALVRWVSELLIAPDEGGTGAFLLLMVPFIHRYGMGLAVGGSQSLSDALAAALAARGGNIRTGMKVERFRFDGDRVTGVRCADGTEFAARRAVLADLNIKQLPVMVEHRFGPEWERQVNRIKAASFRLVAGHIVLSELPEFRAGPEVTEAGFQEITLPLPDLLRTFDQLKYGEPVHTIPTVSTATRWDSSRAPDGHHTLYLLGYAPMELADGDWDTRKEEIFDRVFATFAELTTNIGPAQVLSRVVHSPLDMARYNEAWVDGDAGHFGCQLFQFMGFRPLPNMGYRLPAEGFYLVGPSTHPGQGVTGGARAAALAVLADLGLSFPARG